MDAATLLTLTNSDVPYFDIDSVTDIEEDGDVLLFTATGPTMRALCQWSRDEGVIVIEWREESRVARPRQTTYHDTDDSVAELVDQYLRGPDPDRYSVEMDRERGYFVIRALNAPVGHTYHDNPICHEGVRQESGLWIVSSCYVPTACYVPA